MTRTVPLIALAIAATSYVPAHSQPTLPDFSAATFSDSLTIDNPYFPLTPGTTWTYDAVNTDPQTGEIETELIVVEVLSQTRTVAGIETRVVHDRVWLEGLLIEDTFDFYYQEFYAGEAEDNAEIVGLNETHTIPLGTFANVLHTRDFTLDPTTFGEKFFAPSVGTIMEHDIDAATGTVLGVVTLRTLEVVPEGGRTCTLAPPVLRGPTW